MIKTFTAFLLLLSPVLFYGQAHLDLEDIENVKTYEIHQYSKYKSLTQLTELVNPDSIYALLFHDQSEFPEGFGNLQNLKSVQFYACQKLDYNKIITECLKLKNLIEFTISGISVQPFPENLYNLKTLKKLTIAGNTFNIIPTGIDKLQNLEILYLGDHLAGGNKIITFPKEIINLKKLRVLSLRGNMDIELGNTFYELNALEELDLSFITNLDFEKVCVSFPRLKKLNLTGIEKSTWTGISKLTNLEYLSSDFDAQLINLGEDFSDLKNLKTLDIQLKGQLNSAIEINKIAALPKLEILMVDIRGDNDDFMFPEEGFTSLKSLRIHHGTKATLTEIIDVVSKYPKLEKLDLGLRWETLTSEEEKKLLELSKTMTIVDFDYKK